MKFNQKDPIKCKIRKGFLNNHKKKHKNLRKT